MSTEGITYNDIESQLIHTQGVSTMCFGSHAKTEAKMNTGQVQNFSTFHLHLPSAFSAAAMIIATILLLCLGYCLYRHFLIRQHRRRQAIKDLRSLIGKHDLDHFFHDRELIAITSENDRDLLNFLCPRSRSFYYLYNHLWKCT